MKLNPYVFLEMAQKVVKNDAFTGHGVDVALAGLLDQMEFIYGIPARYNPQWAVKNLDVYAVYCTIGNMRNL